MCAPVRPSASAICCRRSGNGQSSGSISARAACRRYRLSIRKAIRLDRVAAADHGQHLVDAATPRPPHAGLSRIARFGSLRNASPTIRASSVLTRSGGQAAYGVIKDAEQRRLQADDLAGHQEVEYLPATVAADAIAVGPSGAMRNRTTPTSPLPTSSRFGGSDSERPVSALDELLLALGERPEYVLRMTIAASAGNHRNHHQNPFEAEPNL